MPERLPNTLWLRCGLVLLLGLVAVVAFRRAAALKYDFHHFYLDAGYVWQHGALKSDLSHADPDKRRQLPFYLPVVPLLLAPLTAGGALPAAVLWTLGHVAALAYSLSVLLRWAAASGHRSPGAVVALACLLALPAVIEAARFNQLSFYVLALLLGGLGALERNKPGRAGMLMGLAVVLKLLPAVFAVWLVLQRRWRALGALVATALIVSLLPCLIVFGPQRTAEYHRDWWVYNAHGAAGRPSVGLRAGGVTDPSLREHFIDYRNQSIPAVLTRLFQPEHPYRVPFQPVQLSEQTITLVGWGAMAVLAGGLIWVTRQRRPGTDPPTFQAQAATYAVAMLVFSPLLRQYYLVWALPGLVVLTGLALHSSDGLGRKLGRVGLGIWLAGMLAWLSPTARAYGVHLLMLILLGALLLKAARTLRATDGKS